jgi:hydrogenase expression/formation protein HypD
MEISSKLRDRNLVKRIRKKIQEVIPSEQVKLCHICGTHEWTITHSGIRSLLPENISLIAGPGCPVCIVPAREIDEAVWLAENGVTIVTFGDMFRDPGSESSLSDAKSRGADVRVVYSVRDAMELARRERKKKFVFFAIGFETTTPMNALEVRRCPENMSFLISHRIIPPAIDLLAEMDELELNGFIAPGHVSTIIGMKAYTKYPKKYGMPTVISGFEPIDVLMSIYMILKQIKEDNPKLENEYSRAVTYEGNIRAQKTINDTFDVVDGAWRGLGVIQASTLQLKEAYSSKDTRHLYNIDVGEGQDIHPGCSCHLVIIGKITPDGCPLFMKACTPERPKGACMVSSEGTCSIWARHSSL